MIAQIKGKIAQIHGNNVILDVSGVGYETHCPLSVLEKAKVGEEITLFTHQYIREDAMDLYGFLNMDDKEVFELLLSISGVGPKAGVNILSMNSAEEIKQAISQKDESLFTRVSGIGKRTAERIIVDLKDKVTVNGIAPKTKLIPDQEEVVDALKGLGYKHKEARDLAVSIPAEMENFEDKIRYVLKEAGKSK
ncbi:MAG: Holliday junction branch migration protein RuvA [bacterium]